MRINHTTEELFENLENQDEGALIRLADATHILSGAEVSDLINLIQVLAGRLEDVLNSVGLATSDQMPPWPLEEDEDGADKGERDVVEFNG